MFESITQGSAFVRPRQPRRRRRMVALAAATAVVGGSFALVPVAAFADGLSCGDSSSGITDGVLTVAAGDTCTISTTTALDELIIGDGGYLYAPSGYDVTLTVDGVETGQAYDSIEDVTGWLQPGDYVSEGDDGVVLTVTTQHTETQGYVFPIRQALYVDSSGINSDLSVPASWTLGATPTDSSADGLVLTSTGSTFNGVWVDGTTYSLLNPVISFTGDGRDDFASAGAAIVGDNGANLTIDGLDLDNAGVVRTAIISDGGANVVVKNSDIDVSGGTLPSDYVANVTPATMIAAPWMLGLEGTNRATLLLGANSKATYLNTSITAEDWGALSTDSGSNVKLTAINSDVSTLDSGYGTYLIGAATGEYLGTDFDVASYLSISANGDNVLHVGDSDSDSVSALNTSYGIGLTDDDLASLTEQTSTLTSAKYGFMTWAGNNTVTVDGGTVVNTANALFEDKSQTGTTTYNVTGDDEESPSLSAANGVIVQVMNQDDPGPGGSYTDPTSVSQTTTAATRANASLTARTTTNLTDTDVTGDFFNGATVSKNLVVNLSGSSVTGRISTTTAVHDGTVNEANYERIGNVTNTVTAPINGGVIVNLTNGSTWNVTGDSYVTSLTVDDSSTFNGVASIDGVAFTPVAGTTYTGNILVSKAPTIDTATTVSVQTIGSYKYVTTKVTNNSSVAATITVSTPYGDKTFTNVAAGKSVSVSQNTKSSATPTGTVTVTATGTVSGTAVTTTTTTDY
ncbi:MAG: hypothetical protein QM626_03810 [Microbacterium sp.]|uniref:beta strand repeat-containing protein n=1 Tax=Microbacterium sp. TaxID=51671 RepID=UPI0039E26E3E